MRIVDLIRRKRDGQRLSTESIEAIVAGVVAGSVPDYQLAALLMAIFWRGLDGEELSALTGAMLRSGETLDLSAIALPKVDKHSTGGVGDKISLCLAPLVAACGVAVPMVSGRGLGHTGGTLDKLESIPGFRIDLSRREMIDVLAQAGLVLVGQTGELAPADGRLYALRDVTATVESIPLITSSIMSKKLAEGIDALVLDVKVGSGALMRDLPSARVLARSLVDVGRRAGKRVSALITDMNQPLGREVGNAGEMREAIAVLRGAGPDDVWQLTLELGAEMLQLAGVCATREEAVARLRRARGDGSGLERLRRCIALQGGDARVVDDPGLLPAAQHQRVLRAPRSGVLATIDAQQVGTAAMVLGAGRSGLDDWVDPAVGLTFAVRLGDRVEAGDALVTLHYNDEQHCAQAEAILTRALCWSDEPISPPPLIHEALR